VPAGLDAGHVVLAAALAIVIANQLRTRHRRRFGLTITVERSTLDEADSGRKRKDTDDATEPDPDQ
jgi:hypothetical protein